MAKTTQRLSPNVTVVHWVIEGNRYDVAVLKERCPFCFAHAVTELPEPLLKVQPDDTTHVCNPAFGGCNHGFAVT